MHAILVSAFATFATWFFRVVVVKALVFGLLLLVTTEFTAALMEKIAGNPTEGVQSTLNGIGSGALYFFGVLRLDVGLPLILSAYVAGFAIRRLPIIG